MCKGGLHKISQIHAKLQVGGHGYQLDSTEASWTAQIQTQSYGPTRAGELNLDLT
jgi:hypothetical protein